MPTPSGRPTAQEQRDARDERYRAALADHAARIITPDELAADLAAYLASTDDHGKRQHEYPAGAVLDARLQIDEGRVRAAALARAARAAGANPHVYTSIGLFQGRSGLAYGVSEYVR